MRLLPMKIPHPYSKSTTRESKSPTDQFRSIYIKETVDLPNHGFVSMLSQSVAANDVPQPDQHHCFQAAPKTILVGYV
jgi:hypothetical protein